jgi:hypothetical protein
MSGDHIAQGFPNKDIRLPQHDDYPKDRHRLS